VSRQPTILLVDDTPENLLAVEAALEPLGCRIVRAGSGEEALRVLLGEDIAVIVLDVQMPGMDGFETALAIKDRERSRDIPIIFLTALSRAPEHRMQGYATGAVDYLFKPVEADLLRAKVAVFVELATKSADLARSNADLEQFAYIASHDLQEPLRNIGGYLEVLEEHLDGALDGQAREWFARANGSATRMEALIAELLLFARAGAGSYVPAPVDLDAALSSALADLSHRIDEQHAVIRTGPLGRGMGRDSDIRRVFLNLLSNALKYRADRPLVVAVEARQLADAVSVSVCDSGRSVPPADLERVFGLFERSGGEPFPGTGLGLAVCRRLIERAGGTIGMTRNPKGEGVTVTFTLPAPT
jgi:two-component system sensor histidine kinase/response regulator